MLVAHRLDESNGYPGALERFKHFQRPTIPAQEPDRDHHQRLRPAAREFEFAPHLRTSAADAQNLQPGRLSSALWMMGSGLLHSAVVIKDREYAYGGHPHPGVSGVYWTKPRTEPPGGTFRTQIQHGFTMRSDDELEHILQQAAAEFLGPSYNLLSRNCNHFTSALCQKLVSRPAPFWLNRAASIGLALPCVVPRDWIEPPDFETAEGELVDDDEAGENSMMLQTRISWDQPRPEQEPGRTVADRDAGVTAAPQDVEQPSRKGWSGRMNFFSRDTSGRVMPASERAPEPSAR
ncbi:MAG: hypothetical protein M1826_000050 [Phylliscum demangeonii]|nr:MAG: hypothetical protein M1826_000050 [Phylliscum demangeonii]